MMFSYVVKERSKTEFIRFGNSISFDMVVCICPEKAIFTYFDEVQKLSIQDHEI